MSSIKTSSVNIRNIDLVKTYYGSRQAVTKKTATEHEKRPVLPILLMTVACICLLIIVLWLLFYSPLLKQPDKSRAMPKGAIALTPFSKDHNIRTPKISYYNYNDLELSPDAMLLVHNSPAAAINFNGEKDLIKSIFSFMAMGKTGNEKLAIIFKDRNNFSNANPEDKIKTPLLLKDEWQIFELEIEHIDMPLDKSRIKQIRLEAVSEAGASDKTGRIYIKDIFLNHKE